MCSLRSVVYNCFFKLLFSSISLNCKQPFWIGFLNGSGKSQRSGTLSNHSLLAAKMWSSWLSFFFLQSLFGLYSLFLMPFDCQTCVVESWQLHLCPTYVDFNQNLQYHWPEHSVLPAAPYKSYNHTDYYRAPHYSGLKIFQEPKSSCFKFGLVRECLWTTRLNYDEVTTS